MQLSIGIDVLYMKSYILLCGVIYFRQLSLREPDIFISEPHIDFGSSVVVLIYEYVVVFVFHGRHNLSDNLNPILSEVYVF